MREDEQRTLIKRIAIKIGHTANNLHDTASDLEHLEKLFHEWADSIGVQAKANGDGGDGGDPDPDPPPFTPPGSGG